MSRTNFILDTNAITADPEILSRVQSHKLLIPSMVFEEIQGAKRPSINRLGSLVRQAIAKGVEIPQGPDSQNISVFDMTEAKLDGADVEIAMLANDYAKRLGAKNVVVVTMDKALSRWLYRHGIKSMTPHEFSLSTKDDSVDSEVKSIARSLNKQQLLKLVTSAFSSAFVSIVVQYRHAIFRFANEYLSVSAVCLLLFLVGLAAYMWRQRFRLSYGCCETMVGLYITYGAAGNVFNMSTLIMTNWLQIVAGLYVVVRGLDNVGKGMQGTRFEPYWTAWFGRA